MTFHALLKSLLTSTGTVLNRPWLPTSPSILIHPKCIIHKFKFLFPSSCSKPNEEHPKILRNLPVTLTNTYSSHSCSRDVSVL
jgi:hypothetical protein